MFYFLQNGFIKACERGFKEVIKILIGPVTDGVLRFNVNYKDVVKFMETVYSLNLYPFEKELQSCVLWYTLLLCAI